MKITELIIRKATISDLSAIICLIGDDDIGAKREVITKPLERPYVDAFELINNDTSNELIVAEIGELVIGTFQLTFIQYLSHYGGKVAQIESVHIAKEYQGQGLGTEMMKWAIQRAEQKGCHRVQLTSNKSRVRAHRFYEKLGFTASHQGMKLILKTC